MSEGSLNWIWFAVPLMIIGGLLLWFFIVKLVRLVKKEPILNLPLAARQDVMFPEAGRVHLCREGPRREIWPRQAYELLAGDGSPVRGWNLLFKSRVAGISRIRWEQQAYDLPRPGRYTLIVHGLETALEKADQFRIIFIKPSRVQMAGYIVGIALSGVLFLGSLITLLVGILTSGAGRG